MTSLPPSRSAEPRRWTIQHGIRISKLGAKTYTATLIGVGPRLLAGEQLEVMPVSEHDRLREAAHAVIDNPSEDGDWECVRASDLDRLRAALAPADGSKQVPIDPQDLEV